MEDTDYTLIYHGISDRGLMRQNNEDAFVLEPGLGFCTVADGMGGAAAGELASGIFVQTAGEIFARRGAHGHADLLPELIQQTFSQANTRILEHAASHPEHRGMGTTAELLAFAEGGFVLGHLGDSRTYRLRDRVLRQLTADHSLVQEQLRQGLITPAQARTHSMRNVILRAVGMGDELALDLIRGPLLSGDLFLLCSDGLTDMVEDQAILAVLTQTDDLQVKAQRLVELAHMSGGRDNITVVLVEVRPS